MLKLNMGIRQLKWQNCSAEQHVHTVHWPLSQLLYSYIFLFIGATDRCSSCPPLPSTLIDHEQGRTFIVHCLRSLHQLLGHPLVELHQGTLCTAFWLYSKLLKAPTQCKMHTFHIPSLYIHFHSAGCCQKSIQHPRLGDCVTKLFFNV